MLLLPVSSLPMLEASVIVPTRDRAGYLSVALESLAAQDVGPRQPTRSWSSTTAPAEATRVATQAAGERAPVSSLRRARGRPGPELRPQHRHRGGAAPFVVFVDDDVEAPPGWLRELLDGAAPASRTRSCFGGPIQAPAGGLRGCRMCGREPPPITTLDAGPVGSRDRASSGAPTWASTGARSTLPGRSTPAFPYGFDEDMWERRLRERGGHVMYVARAGLVHRRDAARRPPATADAGRLPARRGAARLHRASRRRSLRGARAALCSPAASCTLPLPLRQRAPADGALGRPPGRAARLARRR